MFSAINELVSSSDRVIVTIDKQQDDQLTVAITGHINNQDTDTASPVRQALAKPFIVTGTVDELNKEYGDTLMRYVESFKPLSNSLSKSVSIDVNPVTRSNENSATEVTSPAVSEPPKPKANDFVDIDSMF